MTDFTKVPESYDIGRFLEEVARFYAHGLLDYETVVAIGSDVSGGFADQVAEEIAPEDEDFKEAEDPTLTDAIEVLLADAKAHGLDIVIGYIPDEEEIVGPPTENDEVIPF